MKTKIINAFIITNNENNEILKNASICIENNCIIAVSEGNADDFCADSVIDVQGDIIMPGFVNAFAQNATTLFKGMDGGADILDFQQNILYPFEKKLTPEDVYYATIYGAMQCVQCGITTVLDSYYFAPEIIKAYQKLGMRAFVPTTISLEDNGNRYNFLMQNKNITDSLYDGLVKEIAYCKDVINQSDIQIEDTLKYAKNNDLISIISCGENLDEVGECDNNNQLSPVGYLERLGFFDRKAMIVHGVCIDKDDILLLKQYDVSVVTTPSADLKCGNGIAPIQSMLQQNLNICIGTDGSFKNGGIDFFREMCLLSLLQKGNLNDCKVLPPNLVLKMATLNGAKALGIEDIGVIAPNYKADLIRISLKTLSMNPINDIISNIVYSASKSDIVMTMIDGKVVYNNGKWIGIDSDKIIEKCQNIVDRLKEKK